MQIGDTKSFKRAVMVFCLVEGVLLAVDFGSYYFGRYGLSLAPFSQRQSDLWWILCQDAKTSVGGALCAASIVYLGAGRKRDEGKSNDAA
jgi:hypothetical protein